LGRWLSYRTRQEQHTWGVVKAIMPDLSDRDALVCIYEYTRGPERWYTNTYWNSERPCGRWFGVTVDEGAHVKSLVLSDNRLDGLFYENTRFSSLSNLRVLYLNNNLIRGTIPKCFGTYMVMMEEFNLSWNLFTGEIPEEIFDNMPHLRVLRLDNNQLSGCLSPKFGKLSKLKFLQLHNNQLTGEIPKVGDTLTELNLCEFLPGNRFVGFVPPDAIEMRKWWEPKKTARPKGKHRRVQVLGEEEDRPGSSRGSSRPGSASSRPGSSGSTHR